MFFWSASLYCAAHEFFPNPRVPKTHTRLSTQSEAIPSLYPPIRPSYRLAILGILVGLACLGQISRLCFRRGTGWFLFNQSTPSLCTGFTLGMVGVRFIYPHHLPYLVLEYAA
jgi:hypothetical protein